LPLVAKLGGGNSPRGWAITMGIFGGLMVLLNLVTFATTRERVQPDPRQKSSVRSDIKNVVTCGPWFVMFILTLVMFTMLVLRGSSSNYFFAYYLDQQQIRSFLSGFGLAGSAGPVTGFRSVLNALGLLVNPDGSNAAAVGLSLFFVVGSLVQIVGILFSKPLADRFGNKAVFIAGMFVTMVATLLVFLVGPAQSILWAIGWGPTVPLLWVMIADVADYSEWKTSRRATGFMFAGVLFALKAGLSMGGALSAWVIDAFGYVPNAVQTERALLGIRLGASVYPAILMALCLICLASYKIGKKLNLQIHEELAERRKKFAPA
jgi:Na+/melibiose symporter-like transporter